MARTPASNAPARRVSAFTLVEVLVVVFIISLMAAFVGASLGGRDDLHVTLAAQQLAADLRYLQSRALARREPQLVVVGSSADSLVYRALTPGGQVPVERPIEGGAMGIAFGPNGDRVGRGIVMQEAYHGSAVFGFDAAGSPVLFRSGTADATPADAPVTFTLSADGFSSVVSVTPITGEVVLLP